MPPPLMVTQKLWVMSQPEPEDFTGLRDRGFTAVINNRPDGEAPDQPGSAAEAAAAEAAGLHYAHIPVKADGMTQQDAARFKAEMDAAPGPVVAHCRTGTRSFLLWLMTDEVAHLSDAEVFARADKIGIPRDTVSARLRARRIVMAGGAA